MKDQIVQLLESAKESAKTDHLAGDGIAPEELSRQLRGDDSRMLSDRRKVIVRTMIAGGALSVVGLYQMGVIRHLPEPPLPFLDADRVDASTEAYEWLAAPDGILGVRNSATTLVLAAIGGRDRALSQPWLPIALAAKVTGDAVQALKLTRDQWTKHGALCSWCLLAAGATVSTLKPAYREAVTAARSLLS